IIISHLMSMPNYQEAYNLFIINDVNEDLIMNVGMNRKSKNYDKPYFALYNALLRFIEHKTNDNVIRILHSLNNINGKARTLWKQYIFNTSFTRTIINEGVTTINLNKPLFNSNNEQVFKE